MREKHRKHSHRIIYYAPRIFAFVIGLFFMGLLLELRKGFSFSEFVRAFLPGFIIIITMLLCWNKPRRASILFAALTIIYTIIGWVVMPDSVIGVITLPMIILSAMLIISAKSHLFL